MKITASTSRVRTSFDPGLELPKLQQWFAQNPHPSRLTLQSYVKELNSLSSRQSRRLLEVHNLCYWFKNARAAYKRAELRMKKSQEQMGSPSPSSLSAAQTNKIDNNNSIGTLKQQTNNNNNNNQHVNNNNNQYQQQVAMQVDVPQSQQQQQLQKQTSLGPGTLDGRTSSQNRQRYLEKTLLSSKSSPQISSNNRTIKSASETDANSSNSDIVCIESPSRDSSTSPLSTVSLPAMTTLCQNDGTSTTGDGLIQSRQLQQQQQLQHQQPTIAGPPTLSSVDLANAVNYILSTATNFTAAAAAAAAATAASTTLTSNPLQNPGNLMQLPSSTAINLAATLLNSSLNSNNGGQLLADPTAFAAVLNNRCAQFAADPVAAAAAAVAGVALVDQPVRQLYSAFNPSNCNIALGMLDNKILDTNILNSMNFPTSACAPDQLGGFAQNGLASQLVAGRALGGSHGNLRFGGGGGSSGGSGSSGNRFQHSHHNQHGHHRARLNGSRSNRF